jgi:hypothetical protein
MPQKLTPEQLYLRLLATLDILQTTGRITPLEHQCLHAAVEVAYDSEDAHLQGFINAHTAEGQPEPLFKEPS